MIYSNAARLRTRIGTVATLAILCASSGFVAAQQPRSPSAFELQNLTSEELESSARNGTPFVLQLGGRTLALALHAVDLRSPRFSISAGPLGHSEAMHLRNSKTYSGTVIGEAESQVRLSACRGGVRGYVRDSQGWTFVTPTTADAHATGGEHQVYADTALDSRFHGECEALLSVEALDGSAAAQSAPAVEGDSAPPIAAGTLLRVLEIAVDADQEFYARYGAGSVAEIEATLNEVDGIMRAELGVTLSIVSIHTWVSEPDPYTATAASTLLQELRTAWTMSFPEVDRDVVHLFTGKDLDGSTVGIAYTSVICVTSFAYGLSQDLVSSAYMPLLTAHELGHNLGAGHDTSGTSPQYVMYPSLSSQVLDEYSDGSTTQILAYLDTVSCLEQIEESPPPGSGGGSPPPGPSPGVPASGGGGGGPLDPITLAILLFVFGAALKRASQRVGV
ncbi:MAG: M12 family metallo-peptidase [Planctomycetota bacterium]